MDKETGFYFVFGILIASMLQIIIVVRDEIADVQTDIALIKCVLGNVTDCL